MYFATRSWYDHAPRLSTTIATSMKTPIFQNEIRIIPSPTELPETAELWRYMRLSAFLMLLRGKVYVPTIAELRRGDPNEARMISKETKAYFANLPEPDGNWLLGHATEQENKIIEASGTEAPQKARTFMRIWDRELAERRAVWCWHHADIESMALWHMYGREGVAIKTTPTRLKNAFDPAFVDTALIGRVCYVDHTRPDTSAHHFMRPYLLKQRCYEYENEVRIVFPRNSENPDGGRLLPVKPHELIGEVRISPHIPRSEAVEIRQSLKQAWKLGNKWLVGDDDVSVFVSETTTVVESLTDRVALSQPELTGITSFGSINMPFVMCGDFDHRGHPTV